MHTYFQYCYHAYDYTTTLPHGRMFEMGAKISFNRTQYKFTRGAIGLVCEKVDLCPSLRGPKAVFPARELNLSPTVLVAAANQK